MKIFLVTIALLFCVLVSAQSDFKKGYYISINGVKTEGYIKSSNFRSVNDDSFKGIEFKKTLDQDGLNIEKSLVIEFGSEKEIKLQKVKALIDDVSFYKDFSNEKGFSVQEKTVFLNVLVEGNATLYSYNSGKGVKYFWKIAGEEAIVKQLLYKRYNKSNLNLTENNTFREQLFNHVKCPNQTFSDFLNVKYEEAELVSIFKKYNKCINSPFVVYENENEEKAVIKFSFLTGYSLGNFRVKNIQNPTIPENFSLFSAGLETEIIFASRKASLFGSVEFKKGKGSSERISTTSQFSEIELRQVYDFDAYFIDFILGARYYKKISLNSTFFAGGGVGLNAGTSGSITFSQSTSVDNELKQLNQYRISGNGFFSLHLGCLFYKHWGIDFNYDSPKNLINNAIGTSALVHEFGLNLRYKF